MSFEPVWPYSFKDAFCRQFNCSPTQYEETVFWKTLYPHARPLARLIFPSNPEFFREDFDLIREVGSAQHPKLFLVDLNHFHGRNCRDKNWWRKHFILRIDGLRLLRLRQLLFPEGTYSTSSMDSSDSSTSSAS